MKFDIKLSARLEAAAALACNMPAGVYKGGVADIGTDHALLPIKLVLGCYNRALASDLNEGPCARARENIKKYGLTDKIEVVCRPGLARIEEFTPDTVIICGMGGELIANILSESGYPAASRCRLVLQPMSMQDTLRKYLCSAGFKITEELVVHGDGKYYQLLSAVYDGKTRTLAEYEYRLGRLNLARATAALSPTDKGWLKFIMNGALKRIEGRRSSINSEGTYDQAVDMEMASVIKSIVNPG